MSNLEHAGGSAKDAYHASESHLFKDPALDPVPDGERSHWLAPALIFGGLEFAVPVMMVGAALIAFMSLAELLLLILVAMAIQWVGNALQGYMGAKTGLASAALARQSLGSTQARVVLGVVVGFFTIGWGAVQTSIAGNAAAAMVGVDYEQQRLMWGLITVAVGLAFAMPSVLGYTSIKWVDVIAVPAGIVLVTTGVYLSIAHTGLPAIAEWRPESEFTMAQGIGMILGLNVAQWLIASDYTRYSRPRLLDQVVIPLGILCVGIPLLLVGAIMAVGHGQADIVMVMRELNFPVWGYLVLCLAVWTSQLVNFYSMGIAISNSFNLRSARGRALATLGGTIVTLIVALFGVIDYFMDYLYALGMILPPIVGVMFVDFYIVKRRELARPAMWNPAASVAIVVGMLAGYVTQYHYPVGIPALQSLAAAVLVYLLLSRPARHPQEAEGVPLAAVPEEVG